MIPAGYSYNHVRPHPGLEDGRTIEAFYSVAGCISEAFDYDLTTWLHNGYWFFDTVEALNEALATGEDGREGLTLFYYEVHDREFIRETRSWRAFETFHDMAVHVTPPARKTLAGYDVASFWAGSSPECPGVSCSNRPGVHLNAHGLFESLDEAIVAFEGGAFDGAEPGPLRIFAVYTVDEG